MPNFRLITPINIKPAPSRDEENVARVLAEFLESDIEFVQKGHLRTPDLFVVRLHQYWEIKNIRGNSKRTIENILRSAQYQSENIIISLSRTDMSLQQAVGRVKKCLANGRVYAKRIMIISKTCKVVAIKF